MIHYDEITARDFALKKHVGQQYGTEPYEVHLRDVVSILKELPHPHIDLIVCGWLHDVLEDTDATILDLNAKFGPKITAIVWAVTGVGENRSERMRSVYRKIQASPHAVEATTVKLADRLANVRACRANNPRLLKMYQDEYPLFGCNLSAWGPRKLWKALDAAIRE